MELLSFDLFNSLRDVEKQPQSICLAEMYCMCCEGLDALMSLYSPVASCVLCTELPWC